MLLFDGATINCHGKQIDLSYIKLIENRMTFYMKLGFDFEISHAMEPSFRYLDVNQLKMQVNATIDQVRKIEIEDVVNEYNLVLDIITQYARERDKKNLHIIIRKYYMYDYNEYYVEKPEYSVDGLFQECKIVLDLLNKTKHKYLYQYMIELFKHNCQDYLQIDDYIVNNLRYKIIYKEHTVTRHYIQHFRILHRLRGNFYSYTFKR